MQTFEEVILLKTRFHKLTVSNLIQYVTDAAKNPKKTVVGHVNIRSMNLACSLPWYRKFLNGADLVFCDGFGVILGANLRGYSLNKSHRMTCPDYIESLALTCEQKGVSLFLLAGHPGVTDEAIAKIKTIAPGLRITGHHGHFEKTGAENDAVTKQINQFQPGILYIGFGMPLQEKWIAENIHRIDAKVFLPLGACLDFYTGTTRRGPTWMTNRGLEWLTRLVTEPGRLWSRYLIGNIVFFSRIFVDDCRSRFAKLIK